jgi:polysaccharide biosynthesis protein PslG
VRADFGWSDIEKKKGQYDFSQGDKLFAALDRFKIRAMVVLAYSNPLYDNDLSPHSDEGVAAFAKFAAEAARHFKGRGVMWEIYNEPNNTFWRPEADPAAYIKLALATVKAIKSAEPNELVVGPALSGTDGVWMQAIYKSGLLDHLDAITVHPYGDFPPEGRKIHYDGSKALLARFMPKGKNIPIYSGEWGYSSANVPADVQAKYLARMFLFNLSEGINLSIWYDWRDDGPDPKNTENNFGLLSNAYHKNENPPLKPKPAYLAAKKLMSELDGYKFEKRVKTQREDDYVLQFKKGDELKLAAWTAGSAHRIEVKGMSIDLTDNPQYVDIK